MVKTFADALCGAEYGERSEERTNSRNGYRAREWDTRAGTMEFVDPEVATRVVLSGLVIEVSPARRAGLVSVDLGSAR